MRKSLGRWILGTLVGLALSSGVGSLWLRLDSHLAHDVAYDSKSPLPFSERERLQTELVVEEWVADFFEHLSSEFLVASLVFFVVDLLLRRRERAAVEGEQKEREISRLCRQLNSTNNAVAIQAVLELRAAGSLQDGTLDRIDLSGADLSNAPLQGIIMRNGYCRETSFENATMDGCNLESSRLYEARLRNTSLVSSQLQRCDLRGAVLDSSNLSWADMREAVNLTHEQLSRARMLWGAIMPDGSKYDGRYRLSGDLDEARKWGIDITNDADMAEFFAHSSPVGSVNANLKR